MKGCKLPKEFLNYSGLIFFALMLFLYYYVRRFCFGFVFINLLIYLFSNLYVTILLPFYLQGKHHCFYIPVMLLSFKI